jgi:CTP:molybdopterin cytidylyltransferase MocA
VTPEPPPPYADVVGLVLAAGAGRRMGTPKALLPGMVAATVGALTAAGCGTVTVVLGAEAERAAGLVPEGAHSVVAADWAEGIGASLRRGLAAAGDESSGTVRAALVTLVDLPDVGAAVMERVLDRWRAAGAGRDALVRATFSGRPGHPVLLGRDHWSRLVETLSGDTGAQEYLAGRNVLQVSCEDLATGRDVDRPEDLPRGSAWRR